MISGRQWPDRIPGLTGNGPTPRTDPALDDWIISALVVVILSLATKAGYKIALALGIHSGVKHVLIVEGAYFVANVVTFLLRFLIFHYVLFTDRTTAARAAATGPDVPQYFEDPAGPRAAQLPSHRSFTGQGPQLVEVLALIDGSQLVDDR